MDKQFFVNVVNLETGKVFSLPTLYTDRTEACVCGQNYVRDRQVEDPCAELFFRVLVAKDGQVAPPYSLWEEEEEEEEEEFSPELCAELLADFFNSIPNIPDTPNI